MQINLFLCGKIETTGKNRKDIKYRKTSQIAMKSDFPQHIKENLLMEKTANM